MKLLNRVKWRPNWKTKWFLSILCGVLLVILILFGTSYMYLIQKLTAANEKTSLMSFQETENGLKGMMKNVEYYLSQFANNELAWEYSANTYKTTVEKSMAVQEIVQKFDQMMYADTNIYGFAILSGDGRSVVSTTEKKSRTGIMEIDEKTRTVLEECKESYPFVKWISGESLDVGKTETFYCMVNRPVLLGIVALGEAKETEEDSYLCVALDERKVSQSYGMVSYNGSRAALVDENGRIISSTDPDYLETVYRPREEEQNIEYDLSYHNWKLVNMIPKDEYLREARGIKKTGFLLGGIASLAVLFFCLIWNRKYTKPIQILMDQMEMVGKEQLDIENPEKVGWPELDHRNEEFYHTVQKLKSYISRLQTAEQEKAREELLALQYQINPHFVLNTLYSVQWMAQKEGKPEIRGFVHDLMVILSYNLGKEGMQTTLRTEIDIVKDYIALEQMRYDFVIEMNVEEGRYLEQPTVRMLLQPLVENAIRYGLGDDEKITIQVFEDNIRGLAIITILDSGNGLTQEEINQINEPFDYDVKKMQHGNRGIGLRYVKAMLESFYEGETNLFVNCKKGYGTKITILIPIQEELRNKIKFTGSETEKEGMEK